MDLLCFDLVQTVCGIGLNLSGGGKSDGQGSYQNTPSD